MIQHAPIKDRCPPGVASVSSCSPQCDRWDFLWACSINVIRNKQRMRTKLLTELYQSKMSNNGKQTCEIKEQTSPLTASSVLHALGRRTLPQFPLEESWPSSCKSILKLEMLTRLSDVFHNLIRIGRPTCSYSRSCWPCTNIVSLNSLDSSL